MSKLLKKEWIVLRIKFLKKDMFSHKLLWNLNFSKAKDKFSKYLVNSSGKNNKDRLNVKNSPIFVWSKLRKNTLKALKFKMKMWQGPKSYTENAWFTGGKEKNNWQRSRRRKKSLKLNWKKEKNSSNRPKSNKKDCNISCINQVYILTSWQQN